MMKQVPITMENLDLAVKIQRSLFPGYTAEVNYLESIRGITTNKYYLLYVDGECVGISGIYYYDAYPHDAWLGWFGILPAYRKLHYGSMALALFEDEARQRGFTHVRLYTDKYDNEVAIRFYEANGYTGEDYICPEDPASLQYPVMIYSRHLSGGIPEKWNNRTFDLTDQISKQLVE